MLLSNLGSLNKFNQARDISPVGNIAGRIPSASTVARVADSMDLDCLREILKSICYKAKRSKMISPYCGKWIGIIDGHEICCKQYMQVQSLQRKKCFQNRIRD
jgi:hypothetical protein